MGVLRDVGGVVEVLLLGLGGGGVLPGGLGEYNYTHRSAGLAGKVCERVLEPPPYWGWDVNPPEWTDGYYCVLIWCTAEKGMGVVGVKPLLGLKTNTVTRTPTTVAEHR